MSLWKPSVEAGPFLACRRSRSDDKFNNRFAEKIEFPRYKNRLILVDAFLSIYHRPPSEALSPERWGWRKKSSEPRRFVGN